MNPKEYYYNRFRSQFEEWVKNIGIKGPTIPIQALESKNLTHIPKDDHMLFHCALACTILIDEVMYAHFKQDYAEFQRITQYPKIEYGLSNMLVRPWDITHSGIGLTTLERFVTFFVADLKDFFTKNKFKTATWQSVRKAMLDDKDVIDGSRGEIFKKALEGMS